METLEFNETGKKMMVHHKKMVERREFLIEKIEGQVGRLNGLNLLPAGTLERLYEIIVESNE